MQSPHQSSVEDDNTKILENTAVSNNLLDLGMTESLPPGEPVKNPAAEARGNCLDGCSYKSYATRTSAPQKKVHKLNNNNSTNAQINGIPQTKEGIRLIKSSHLPGPKIVNRLPSVISQSCTRLILTNTGSLTTKQLHLALQNSLCHHPETYKEIRRVHKVHPPNRRTRFDLWVDPNNAASKDSSN